MQYKFFVYCPNDGVLVEKLIHAASECGAGVYGKYSSVAFVTEGTGYWKPEHGAKPVQGVVGKISKEPVCRLEMTCDSKDIDAISTAIKKAHPWEQVDIECIEIQKII